MHAACMGHAFLIPPPHLIKKNSITTRMITTLEANIDIRKIDRKHNGRAGEITRARSCPAATGGVDASGDDMGLQADATYEMLR